MADTLDIINELKQLGLNEVEGRAYLFLSQRGTLPIMRLSKLLNLPRTTTYRMCEGMVKKKVLEWVVERQGTRIKSVNVDGLKVLVKEKQQEVERMTQALGKLKTNLPTTIPIKHTQVRYYYGIEGLRQLVWNSMRAKDAIYGYSVYSRDKYTGEKLEEEYWQTCLTNNIKDYVIVNTDALERVRHAYLLGAHKFQKIRVIPENNFYISGDTYIYNNIYAVNFWENDEIFGVEIENSEIVKVQKAIFNYIWERAKPLEKYITK